MTARRIQPDGLFQRTLNGNALYSHVLIGSGRSLVFVSGQVSRDKEGRVVGAGDMRAQIQQVGENLLAALRAAGVTIQDLVKTTTYVTDIDEFFKHADLRHKYFGQAMPTSTTVEVRRLSQPELLVEVEAIAEVRE